MEIANNLLAGLPNKYLLCQLPCPAGPDAESSSSSFYFFFFFLPYISPGLFAAKSWIQHHQATQIPLCLGTKISSGQRKKCRWSYAKRAPTLAAAIAVQWPVCFSNLGSTSLTATAKTFKLNMAHGRASPTKFLSLPESCGLLLPQCCGLYSVRLRTCTE